MGTEVENSRPNIRIQIVNNMSQLPPAEKMDVDAENNDNEEGEISDDNVMDESSENVGLTSNSQASSGINAIFTTGIDIFDKKEQEKLQERAKRFALKPNEIHSFTDQDLQELHESLGINHTNESEVKFEKVHLLGLGEMTAEDVVDYFANYAPEGIEWIDQNSCTVVWLDNISAARALHFKSRVVRGMPAREPKDIFPKEFLDDVEESELENGQSILIKNKNREIELQNEIGEVILPQKKHYPQNSVDISEITIPVPPGYWRLGNQHPKTKCLLVRFGLVTDKLPFKTEKCNRYYKKLSNPGQRNVISEMKKKELRSIFERNRELNQSKNPWGSLAKNWDRDARFREREPVMHSLNEDDEVQIVEVKNPKLLARLGTKRKRESGEETAEVEENKNENGANDKLISERKKIKVPRMKMYADEEEENRKRKKILMSIKKQAEEIDKKDNEGDLRNMLGPTNRLVLKKDLPEAEPNVDLGTRLKNRSQRMVFAVERDTFDHDYYDYNTRHPYSDIRRELIERSHLRHGDRERERSPLVSRSVLIRTKTKEERTRLSPERQRQSERERTRTHRSSRRRTPERTLHSDRMHSSRSSHSRRRSYSPENRRGEKPRSKVAVVVRPPPIKPTVASTIWSKVKKSSESDQSSSESESESEESENSSSSSSSSDSRSDSESEQESNSSSKSSKRRIAARNPDRPGFDKSRLSQKVNHKSPLKITTANEHFKQRKLRKF